MHNDTSGRRDEKRYAICVQGHLGSRWAARFEGMALTTDADGTSTLEGPVVDQSALHGLLTTLRDIGLPLVSVTQLAADAPTTPVRPTTTAREGD